MAKHTNQDFIRGDGSGQHRTLGTTGLSAIAILAVIAAVFGYVYPKATAPKGTHVHLVLPTLGPGVEKGSRVLLRGAEVGEVTGIDSTSPDAVHLDVVLRAGDVRQLTDALQVDYRPQNYFGVTAVNLIAESGGSPLRDGQTLHRSAAPDFTMSTMIERSSIVVDGSLTTEMIDRLDEVMKYANGLAPLIRTGIILSDQVSRTQRNLPSTLLNRMNGIAEAFPGFNIEAMKSLDAISGSVLNKLPDGSRGVNDDYMALMNKSLAEASDGLFGAVGILLKSHADELTPLVTSIKYVLDPVPGMIGGGASMDKIAQAISQLRSTFRGTEEQKTLQLRIVLDTVPGVASSLDRMTAGAATGGR